jgi:hypothetical protein
MTTVYDLIPDFGSYVADVERNLAMDADDWARYQRDPRPYLADLLWDYGSFPRDADVADVEAAVDEALDGYLGRA